MLVLSRKKGEMIVIDDRITVKVVRIKGRTVGIGIEAPTEVPIRRGELVLNDQDDHNEPELMTAKLVCQSCV